MQERIKMSFINSWELNNQVPKDPSPIGLIDFVDNSFAEDLKEQKLVISYYFFLNRTVVSWYSKKQRTILISMTEVEYITLGHAAREMLWIRRLVNESSLNEIIVKSIALHEDNKMSIALTKNAKSQHQTKHIDVQYYYI